MPERMTVRYVFRLTTGQSGPSNKADLGLRSVSCRGWHAVSLRRPLSVRQIDLPENGRRTSTYRETKSVSVGGCSENTYPESAGNALDLPGECPTDRKAKSEYECVVVDAVGVERVSGNSLLN